MSDEEKAKLEITHITVRQSISVLIIKLTVLDIFAAGFVVIFFSITFSSYAYQNAISGLVSYNLAYFSSLVTVKIFITLFIILQWLNEYYEIHPNKILHKKGIIWKKEKQYSFTELQSLDMDQGLIGRILNYGTISLYDYRERKYADLYLIHNTKKYYRILEKLLPKLDKEKKIIREKVFEDEDE